MQNIKITVSYDGTNYYGWQKQKGKKTIQGTLEKALRRILKRTVKLTGSGRTDAGVHAFFQCANFKTDKLLVPVKKLPYVLNRLLPEDIRVLNAEEVDEGFDARRSAKAKTYMYVISNLSVQSPFSARYSWHIPEPLDVTKMRKAARTLIGKHDFRAFMSSGSVVSSTVREVKKIVIKKKNSQIMIIIRADGFLKQMVRNIVGTLVEAGKGKRTPQEVAKILSSRDRTKAGICAPAHGLFLLSVDY